MHIESEMPYFDARVRELTQITAEAGSSAVSHAENDLSRSIDVEQQSLFHDFCVM